MSWDVVLFNSKQIIKSVMEIDESQLLPTNFSEILEKSFKDIIVTENHREIKGKDFSIDYFQDNEKVSNKMISLYGENGLFELIELAKKYKWQIFDTSLEEMIDLENPHKNGFENHKKYVEQIMKKE